MNQRANRKAVEAIIPDVERTSAGLQMVIPGCERRTRRASTSRVDEAGQGLLEFYRPPSLREQLDSLAEAPLRPGRARLLSAIYFKPPR